MSRAGFLLANNELFKSFCTNSLKWMHNTEIVTVCPLHISPRKLLDEFLLNFVVGGGGYKK
jgi:hypothetical protein